MPFIDDKQDFMFICDSLFKKPTVTEHQIATRLAKTPDPNNHNTIDDSLAQIRFRQKLKWVHNLIIHYTDEARLTSYNVTKTLVHRRSHYRSTSIPIKPKQNT